MSPLDRTEVLAGWPLDAPSLSLAVTVSYTYSACGAVEQFLTTKVAVLLIVGCAFLSISLRGLEGVPGLPGTPQDEAGLTRKFETSHVGGDTHALSCSMACGIFLAW